MQNHDSKLTSPSCNMPRVFVRAMLSMVLLWLSFPPVGLPAIGWFALIPLFTLVTDERTIPKNGYRKVWGAGLLYWLATFYFIPIPHPALWAGWIVISLYLACYLPIFLYSARTLCGRFQIPALLAIPICWTGLEYIRCHLFTGMGLVCLSHTQFQFPAIIQISDIFGAYTLTFAMTCFGIAVWQLRFFAKGKVVIGMAHIATAAGLFAFMMIYANNKLYSEFELAFTDFKAGLLQGSVDTVFPSTEKEEREFYENKTRHYQQLYESSAATWKEVDVIIWPENGWPVPDLHPDTDKEKMIPRDRKMYEDFALYAWTNLFVNGSPPPPVIAGVLTVDPIKNERRGAAICINKAGEVQDRYYKNHLVMFGEYVPLAEFFPLLQRIPAIGKGLVAGTQSTNFDINGVSLAPNICFESTVPHFIRNQVLTLKENDSDPQILVNLTNDGWFYGTSCLDFHLACNVFRAVEMRKSVLVCANTGFSAHINQRGEIIQQGPRRESANILANVSGSKMDSPYLAIGDWIPFAFAVIVILGFGLGLAVGPDASNPANEPDATESFSP